MVGEVVGQAGVLLVEAGTLGQVQQTLSIVVVGTATAVVVGMGDIEPVPQLQRVGEQFDHLSREDARCSGLLFQQAARTPQRMVDALLMGRVLKTKREESNCVPL